MLSLTTHLLALSPSALEQATTHPFLTASAKASLPAPALKTWLSQDRLYQLAYVNFIGTLLSRLPIPAGSNRSSTLEWRAADFLIDALTNIREEMALFESVASRENFLEEICDGVEVQVPTRVYQDLFAGATAQGRGVLVGLVVLWATEECYLRAWKFAKGQMGDVEEGEKDVMQRDFIPAWTSEGFEKFVGRIRGLVDEFGERVGRESGEWRECENAFRQVLWAEREFWPKM